MWHIGFDDARKPSQAEIDQALKRLHESQIQRQRANRLS